MKKGVLSIVFAIFACSLVYGQDKVRAEYIEETELVSVVAHLAGVPGYNFGEDEALADYVAEVDSAFAQFKKHKAVTFVAKKLVNEGFSWDFPMSLALRFKIDDGRIVYKNDLRDDNYYERISRKNEKKFLSLLEDFYHKSNFNSFFTTHRPLYDECEAAMQQVVDSVDFNWFDSFFGPRHNSAFKVYLGILIGPANYAVHQKYKEGREVVNAMMGCCDRNEQGKIYYGMHYTLPILIHECCHSYCNPLNEEFWEQIKNKATEIFTANADFYASIAYGNSLYVMNETFVEACVIRYLMSHSVDFEIEDWIKMDEVDKKFVLIRDIINILQEREDHPELYPTMHDFMPIYIETVNDYKKQGTER